MDGKAFMAKGKKVWNALGKNKYFVLIMLAGALLLVLPDSNTSTENNAEETEGNIQAFSVEAVEGRIEETLSRIDGAGRVQVMLTVSSGTKQIYAQDISVEQDDTSLHKKSENVILAAGTGKQEPVLVQQVYPQFQGAVVIAPGGDDPSVRLKLTEAVAALTGLGTDKIIVCKGK